MLYFEQKSLILIDADHEIHCLRHDGVLWQKRLTEIKNV